MASYVAIVLLVTVSLLGSMSLMMAMARVDVMGMFAKSVTVVTMTMDTVTMETVTVTVVTLGRYVAMALGASVASLRTVVVLMAVFLVNGILGALAILLFASEALLVGIRFFALVGIVVVVVSVRAIAALLALSISAAMNVTVMTLGVIVDAVFAMGVH